MASMGHTRAIVVVIAGLLGVCTGSIDYVYLPGGALMKYNVLTGGYTIWGCSADRQGKCQSYPCSQLSGGIWMNDVSPNPDEWSTMMHHKLINLRQEIFDIDLETGSWRIYSCPPGEFRQGFPGACKVVSEGNWDVEPHSEYIYLGKGRLMTLNRSNKQFQVRYYDESNAAQTPWKTDISMVGELLDCNMASQFVYLEWKGVNSVLELLPGGAYKLWNLDKKKPTSSNPFYGPVAKGNIAMPEGYHFVGMQDVGRLLVVNNETEHYNVLDMKAPGLSASSPSPAVFTVLVEDSMFRGSNYDDSECVVNGTSKVDCMKKIRCGWCETAQKCLPGAWQAPCASALQPAGTCGAWTFSDTEIKAAQPTPAPTPPPMPVHLKPVEEEVEEELAPTNVPKRTASYLGEDEYLEYDPVSGEYNFWRYVSAQHRFLSVPMLQDKISAGHVIKQIYHHRIMDVDPATGKYFIWTCERPVYTPTDFDQTLSEPRPAPKLLGCALKVWGQSAHLTNATNIIPVPPNLVLLVQPTGTYQLRWYDADVRGEADPFSFALPPLAVGRMPVVADHVLDHIGNDLIIDIAPDSTYQVWYLSVNSTRQVLNRYLSSRRYAEEKMNLPESALLGPVAAASTPKPGKQYLAAGTGRVLEYDGVTRGYRLLVIDTAACVNTARELEKSYGGELPAEVEERQARLESGLDIMNDVAPNNATISLGLGGSRGVKPASIEMRDILSAGGLVPATCEKVTKSSCVTVDGCGWCDSRRTCLRGSVLGPMAGACEVWQFGRVSRDMSRWVWEMPPKKRGAKKPPKDLRTKCTSLGWDSCVTMRDCGWCGSGSIGCSEGSSIGPVAGKCGNWEYGANGTDTIMGGLGDDEVEIKRGGRVPAPQIYIPTATATPPPTPVPRPPRYDPTDGSLAPDIDLVPPKTGNMDTVRDVLPHTNDLFDATSMGLPETYNRRGTEGAVEVEAMADSKIMDSSLTSAQRKWCPTCTNLNQVHRLDLANDRDSLEEEGHLEAVEEVKPVAMAAGEMKRPNYYPQRDFQMK